MKYLFYDCEGANSFNKVSKICSFGYVLCDTDFNIIEMKDLLINPEDVFDFKLFKKNSDIRLAYPKKTFYESPNFKKRYNELKMILEKEDTLILGFSLLNDIKYIIDGCKRYNLDDINFKYLDVQEVHQRVYKLPHLYSLDNALEHLNLEIPENMHRSDIDAYETMCVFKGILEDNHSNLDEIIRLSGLIIKTIDDYKREDIIRANNKLERKKAYFERVRKYKELYSFFGDNNNQGAYKGKVYAFSKELMSNPDEIVRIAEHIFNNGGTIKKELNNSTLCIYKDKMPLDVEAESFISLDEFKINKEFIIK